MNRKYIGFYVVTGVLILSVLALLVSKYYFDWFRPQMSKYATFNEPVQTVNVAETANVETNIEDKILEDEEEDTDVKKEEVALETPPASKPAAKEPVAARKIIPATPLPPQKHVKNTEKAQRNWEKTTSVEEKALVPAVATEDSAIKEFNIDMNQQNFHSLGEYVSADELKYRSELIGKLTINTIVIDKLSKGNGISQEFFRVAYVEKMIPSKVLRDIVESKEFRDLIPAQYLSKEGATAKVLAEGEKVTFNAFAIKNLLELWSEGKLTPVQKAWLVGADGRVLD